MCFGNTAQSQGMGVQSAGSSWGANYSPYYAAGSGIATLNGQGTPSGYAPSMFSPWYAYGMGSPGYGIQGQMPAFGQQTPFGLNVGGAAATSGYVPGAGYLGNWGFGPGGFGNNVPPLNQGFYGGQMYGAQTSMLPNGSNQSGGVGPYPYMGGMGGFYGGQQQPLGGYNPMTSGLYGFNNPWSPYPYSPAYNPQNFISPMTAGSQSLQGQDQNTITGAYSPAAFDQSRFFYPWQNPFVYPGQATQQGLYPSVWNTMMNFGGFQ